MLLLILLPLIGFLINGVVGKKLPKNVSGWIGSVVVLGAFFLSLKYFFSFLSDSASPVEERYFDWISFGNVRISFGLYADQLSSLWLLIVTGIGFLIHVYSISYMHDDENFSRFFAYLNLFIFFMLLLVLGSNILVTFIGWEGVGLCSYLLIGFWYKNDSYNDAAKKAFVMNRIGDLGLLLGMFMLLFYTGTLDYKELRALASQGGINSDLALVVSILLFVGAIGKSAQIPLYTWLPDAMAGPTPVSALIHAATMVTAGIYLLVRTAFLYDLAPLALDVVAIVGVATAIFAATIGVFQNDIKKVLAYSTVSQLGLMFMAIGAGAYVAAVFHVLTHAFFKACLFLGSGSVIHTLHGEQDIRNMGGLKKWMPVTYLTFLISSLAIAGIPPFSGFFSKDEMLAAAFSHNKGLWIVAVITSVLTAFYMFRLVFLTFFNGFRGTEEQQHHLHESPALMTVPLIILALLALIGGIMGIPEALGGSHWLKHFLAPVTGENTHSGHALTHQTELVLMAVAALAALASIVFAYVRFVKQHTLPPREGEERGIARIIYRKYYVDEIYELLFVKPVLALSVAAYELFDILLLDGMVNQMGRMTQRQGRWFRRIQTGNTGFYLIVMALAVAAVLGWIVWQVG
ncbi:MAG: NADH-quinone oxidoreductase subunit L [Chitinophagales bacterium]|nr:NADH-quinone oxidoreductase subunit L [Chitinophagales bacterium]MDW8272985.1 NADH-quinone oxidoreductase subunit L [Chitinophagales bacterium]